MSILKSTLRKPVVALHNRATIKITGGNTRGDQEFKTIRQLDKRIIRCLKSISVAEMTLEIGDLALLVVQLRNSYLQELAHRKELERSLKGRGL